ncbi:PREDICTED: myoD family inhibitor [Myotis brandtii]|uniref:myoD family inhibitor n=1 Tax=Myotis brandtii TaxID=109478 RepID=UPI0007041D56|nr:PREDICTED: myoD family inhibitor [Myotis brandtii]
MPQGNGPGAPQALGSTDLDVPTEAVTRAEGLGQVTAPLWDSVSSSVREDTAQEQYPEDPASQPQGNPLGCTPLLANGSGHPLELGGARRAGNGALGGPKAHRKLQAHPSLASQGSKKSKGSTKSAASQIPLQAQEAPTMCPALFWGQRCLPLWSAQLSGRKSCVVRWKVPSPTGAR